MAKGLRSSAKKANKAKLRSTLFSKIEDARNERLSAKLMELAAKPKEPSTKADENAQDEMMDENDLPDARTIPEDVTADSKMMVDEPEISAAKSKRRIGKNRIQKKSAKKSIVFPVGRKDHQPRMKGKRGHRQKR